MKLECYLTEGSEIDIQPAASRRAWMDETAGRFAYRCLPLASANTHGWVLRCSQEFEAEWNGGKKPEDVEVIPTRGAVANVTGHFGSGMLTFSPGVIFKTSPGFNLWVTGPANRFKDGIQSLSGLVETDWLPFPFTMNWKFTRPHFRIRFEKGEPFCLVFPVQRHLLEKIEPAIKDLSSDPELEKQYQYAHFKREIPQAIELLKGKGAETDVWQKWYLRGKLPDDSGYADQHQRAMTLKPFARRTRGEE